MERDVNLKGKTAIVTGGGSGIGRAIALRLAGEGVRIAVCGRRPERLEGTLKEIRQSGGEGFGLPADLAIPEEAERLVQKVLERFGKIDILVNNAGVYEAAPAHELSPEGWDTLMDLNLRAAALLMRAVLPGMRAQKSGHIINISSDSGEYVEKGEAVYGVSKHALNYFGEYVQKENHEFNIRVNAISPGFVITEMTEGFEGLHPEKCLVPEDIADLAVWLLTRHPNVLISPAILIRPMLNPLE